MDHNQAARIQAPTRYLLGELSLPEREEFEEHFFTCRECAEELRTGAMFAANARAVFREQTHRPTPVAPAVGQPDTRFWAWLRPSFQPALTAAFAIALIAVMVHDRSVISSIRNEVAQFNEESLVPAPYRIHATERGIDQSITVPKNVASFHLTFDIPPADPADKDVPLAAQIDDDAGRTRYFTRLPFGESATLRLPASKYPAGSYILVLRHASPDAKEINRYRFSLAYE